MTNNTTLLELEKRLIESMVNYMTLDEEEEFEADDFDSYTQDDINTCEEIIDDYLKSVLSGDLSNAEILKHVETTIVKLNKLNEKCDHQLIETGQREDICEIIIEAARLAGFVFSQDDEDITYEWREW